MPQRDGVLVLIRHGQSAGNQKNIFTGWRDLHLTARGRKEALSVSEQLAAFGAVFDSAFSSKLTRASDTALIILEHIGGSTKLVTSSALNERNYGELTGLNKTEAIKRWSAEQIWLWRRFFDQRPPGGKSLKDTANRVLPYYRDTILPRLLRGEYVLVVAHGNSLRALIMMLENLSPGDTEKVELHTGEIRGYAIDSSGSTKKIYLKRPDAVPSRRKLLA